MSKLMSWFPIIVAAVSGMAMALQGTLNSTLSTKTSLLASTMVVHLIGLVVAIIVLLVTKTPVFSYEWTAVPWYYYLGGVLSVLIISLVALGIQKVGVCNATIAIIIGQVITAVIIDHFGLFGMNKLNWNPWQILGIILFAAGAKLLYR